MAVKIRLARGGAKKRPFYRIVAADSRFARDGRFLERLGHYNPLLPDEHPDRIVIKEDRVKHYLGHGAQVSDRMARFLDKAGILPGATRQRGTGKKAAAIAAEKAKAEAESKAAAEPVAAPAAEPQAEAASDAAEAGA